MQLSILSEQVRQLLSQTTQEELMTIMRGSGHSVEHCPSYSTYSDVGQLVQKDVFVDEHVAH